eukprot:UN27168
MNHVLSEHNQKASLLHEKVEIIEEKNYKLQQIEENQRKIVAVLNNLMNKLKLSRDIKMLNEEKPDFKGDLQQILRASKILAKKLYGNLGHGLESMDSVKEQKEILTKCKIKFEKSVVNFFSGTVHYIINRK